MSKERKFALIVWEQTEEFKREIQEAEKRFVNIRKKLFARGFECTYLGSLRMNKDCEPEIWLNDNRNIYKDNWTLEEAIAEALEHGDTGWWTLDELEQFVEGKGPIFEEAMWNLGFRRHKKNPNKWARRNPRDRYNPNEYGDPHSRRWEQKHKIEYLEPTKGELERLNQLLVLPNEDAGLNKTYWIQVNKRGLIYVELQVNPFSAKRTEDLGWFDEMLRNRGHIAKQQNGFYIEARNITLGKEKGVYIKAIRPDNSFIECVWPHQIPQPKIYDLADDLVSRVRALARF